MRTVTAQKRKRQSLYVKRRNKTLKVLGISLGSFLFLFFIFIYKSFVSPVVSALNTGSEDLRLSDVYSVLVGNLSDNDSFTSLSLFIIQKPDNKLYELVLPVDTVIDMPGKLGEESLSEVVKIGEALLYEGDGYGLLVEAVEKMTLFHVDRYVVTTNDADFDFIVNNLTTSSIDTALPWNYTYLTSKTRTNLSLRESMDLFSYSRSLEVGSRVSTGFSDLSDTNAFFRDIALNTALSQEGLGVVVLNGTGSSDLASSVGVMCENSGMKVVLLENTVNLYEHTIIITDSPNSQAVKKLSGIFPNARIVGKSAALGLSENYIDRGDVTLILGFDTLSLVQ